MATIINTPGGNTDGGGTGAAGWVVAIIAIILLGLLAVWVMGRADEDRVTDTTREREDNGVLVPPTVNNYNTTLNSTTTITNSTTSPR